MRIILLVSTVKRALPEVMTAAGSATGFSSSWAIRPGVSGSNRTAQSRHRRKEMENFMFCVFIMYFACKVKVFFDTMQAKSRKKSLFLF